MAITSLFSCNQNPKCDDKEVKETVVDILKESYFKNFRAVNADDRILRRHPEIAELPLIKNQPEHRDVFDSDPITKAYSAYYRKNFDAVPPEIFDVVKEEYDIYIKSITPEIKNIRINYEDDETKSCSCSADAVYPSIKKDINYSAQKNTDGETYVEVYKIN